MKLVKFLLVIFCAPSLMAQTSKPPLLTAIKKDDLRKDVYEIASDHYRGREAGTTDELTAAARIANMAKEAGIQPAGDNGTYFQFFNLERHQFSPFSSVAVDGKNIPLFKKLIPHNVSNNKAQAPILILGQVEAKDLRSKNIKGKVVVLEPVNYPVLTNIHLAERRYPEWIKGHYYDTLAKLGAKAVIFAIDGVAEQSWDDLIDIKKRGLFGIKGFKETPIVATLPVFWVKKMDRDFLVEGKMMDINLQLYHSQYPSVNVIGKIEGSDAALKNEYVVMSGHHDHEGVRHPVNGDSIYNGADDNASTCAALLAIARAYKKQKGKRSILFVFHGAEERYLLGSFWHMNHLVVPKEKIVAVLNADMIGRNNINEAALLGSTVPHMTSKELVEVAMQANSQGPKFKLLEEWDKPDHPEIFFFRSDHLPYARQNIPSLFFTSVLHNEYHTPRDCAENIDYNKLHKMTEWMYRTSWLLSNQKNNPKALPNVKFER